MSNLRGEVVYRVGNGPWKELTAGTRLSPGAEIFTGVDSGVRLTLFDGDTMDLDELTQLQVRTIVESKDRNQLRVQLKVGAIKANVEREKSVHMDFTVRTPAASAGVRGTSFRVFYDAVARAAIVTHQGSVTVDPVRRGLPTKLVGAGREIEVTRTSTSRLAREGQAGARGGLSRILAGTSSPSGSIAQPPHASSRRSGRPPRSRRNPPAAAGRSAQRPLAGPAARQSGRSRAR